MTDDELREIMANLALSQAKTDAQLAQTDAQLAQTSVQLAKTDETLKQLAQSQAQMDEKLNEKLDKIARAQAKTDVQLAKTDAKLKKLAEMYGDVGNNQGKVAEEFYYHSLKHKPELNDIHFDFIEKNVTRSKGGIEEEYDLLLVNGQDVFIVEVK